MIAGFDRSGLLGDIFPQGDEIIAGLEQASDKLGFRQLDQGLLAKLNWRSTWNRESL